VAYKNPREWAGARPWRVEDDLVMAASKNVYRIETTIKPRTKSDTFRIISENTELTKRQVSDVFEALSAIIEKDLGKGGPGVFSVPGLMKVAVQHKSAVPERRGINPFTGEETTFKAKPARNVVKVRPLKGLKDMV